MAEPNTYFTHARYKVQWADRHINQLSRWIEAIAESDYGVLGVDSDTQPGRYILYYETDGSMLDGLPLCIGDAVHNLRTSLDYVTTAIVGSDDNRVGFPMDQTRDGLVKSGSYRLVERAAPDTAAFIADEIRPYEAANYNLWALGKLDNFDKHKLLIPMIAVTGFTGVDAVDENENQIRPSIHLSGPGRVNLVNTNSRITIHGQGKPVLEITFSKGHYFELKPVIPTLVQLSELVLETIKALELFHFGERTEG